ncbi:MAG: 2-amino-4-hydroxy-6-hydroxymethyldihydropteridine diphosphokinase, partial [Peptococcaceae bacterium]|nr:2-amino-4-hydroxy-6-hydroxymethyldihydropteridine diphosphokinase [Peptococcaceae bacterium]
MDKSNRAVVYIGLGSNIGDKKANIERALALLAAMPEINVLEIAPFYRTAPQGYTEQDWFINTVAKLETTLPPPELLDLLLALENKIGRVRQERWGPRIIDLDLLLYGNVIMDSQKLTLPHPRMHKRAFVMV